MREQRRVANRCQQRNPCSRHCNAFDVRPAPRIASDSEAVASTDDESIKMPLSY